MSSTEVLSCASKVVPSSWCTSHVVNSFKLLRSFLKTPISLHRPSQRQFPETRPLSLRSSDCCCTSSPAAAGREGGSGEHTDGVSRESAGIISLERLEDRLGRKEGRKEGLSGAALRLGQAGSSVLQPRGRTQRLPYFKLLPPSCEIVWMSFCSLVCMPCDQDRFSTSPGFLQASKSTLKCPVCTYVPCQCSLLVF